MINIILDWDGDWNVLNIDFHFDYSIITEMTMNSYILLLKEADHFDIIEVEMELQNDVFVVGTYNKDGTQYIWGNKVNRNHTTQKYKNHLNNKKTYDQEGELIEDRPYTNEESKNIHVNKFYGHSDRQL